MTELSARIQALDPTTSERILAVRGDQQLEQDPTERPAGPA